MYKFLSFKKFNSHKSPHFFQSRFRISSSGFSPKPPNYVNNPVNFIDDQLISSGYCQNKVKNQGFLGKLGLHTSNSPKCHSFQSQFRISSSGLSPKYPNCVKTPAIYAGDQVISSGYLLNKRGRNGSVRKLGFVRQRRGFCRGIERETMQYDVVIVGGGPSGLSAAIRLKQLCVEKDVDLSVCVVDKGSEIGAHILSGNVFEPRALDELIPNWKQEQAPIDTSVSCDKFWFLTKDRALSLPSPFDNKGNYVISLSQLVSWMGTKAEELGVEIYPGFAASEVLYNANHEVVGIATNDMGIAKDGSRKDNFQRGVELKGRVTLLAEGCRGSLSEKIIRDYKLREKGNAQHQTYALGIKEVWEIDASKHQPGYVLHTLGWPLDSKTYGGSFLYHMKDNLVSVGLVVALDYKNPYLNPYEEFQKLKQHPAIKSILEGGSVIQYGARTLNEGGFQSIPYPVFPGGAIVGCSAGFLNVPKIKGTHTAMKSGILAAESAFGLLHEGLMMESYWHSLQSSWIWDELYKARNYRPAFEYGLIPGLTISAIEHYILRGRSPWTLKHGKPDHEATDVANRHSPIQYPKPDGVFTFDVATSLYRSNTNHDHDQPSHLRLKDPVVPDQVNLPVYAGPESRYCPARVYEYLPNDEGEMKLQINAQNCLHCKACDIKDPTQNIEWSVPEGGGGPGYTVM